MGKEKDTTPTLDVSSSGSPSIPSDKEKLEDFYHSYAMHAFSVVLNDFPLKIKKIESMKQEFDWQLIATLKVDTEWLGQLTQTHFKAGAQVKLESRPSRCIMYNRNKPFLFDVYERNGSSMLPTNETIHRMVQSIKPYIKELSDITLKLSFAIELLEPKFQEGNNFGVEVQAKTLSIVNDAYASTQGICVNWLSFVLTNSQINSQSIWSALNNFI